MEVAELQESEMRIIIHMGRVSPAASVWWIPAPFTIGIAFLDGGFWRIQLLMDYGIIVCMIARASGFVGAWDLYVSSTNESTMSQHDFFVIKPNYHGRDSHDLSVVQIQPCCATHPWH